ncbi:hypothetical protein A2V82_12830 [candidate division KSB1 bacterium RBG_16_48_16]|nr:MAG: hypothetical protein A2V82_12830 [candidate division KSB1 bacterium RBG_16_48_16]
MSKDRNPRGDQNDPTSWQASHDIHGSPGKDDEASTLVNNKADKKPLRFQLDQNYPNPFNSSTTLSYHLPADAEVQLVIFDIVGRTVRTFRLGNQLAGSYHIAWNGIDETGNQVASGVYFMTLFAKNGISNFVETRKMVLIK